MEKPTDIIENIKRQKTIDPPENLVSRVMSAIQKVESGFLYKFNLFIFQPWELSSDAVSILSGKIISHRQCSFLLFMVGLLYFIVGLIVIAELRDALSDDNINLWLRIQPYVTIASAILIIGIGFIILYKPQTIIAAKYSIVLHTAFIVVNALILEFMLFSPQAIFFALLLTAAATVLGLLLVGSIQNLIKFTFRAPGVIVRKILKVEKGFTFLEIIAILVIIGIISAFAISRITSTAAYGIIAELDKVESHLRYAQSRAIRTDSNWGIRFSSANTYFLFQNNVANAVIFAGEDHNPITLSNMSITSAPQTITFDRFGSPGTANIPITTSGGNITVTANTGFVP